MTKKIIPKNGYQKMQNLTLILNPLKQFQKNSCEKSYQQKRGKNMSFLLLLLCAKVFGFFV
jgi:hypothetical protein